ncbi:hypothetical protein AGMMS50256_28170 [Betaproteobacteria bacterium]|nr:hypothetical protein AGMMS50256_28170 [Betaproteobacteria bacterium]
MTPRLLTPHQSQYYAWLLTRRAAGDSVESLASTLVDSQVDLNPHQVDAALFACRNPLSRGVILADEVGLGKTIEAGLVISQRWAERRRKMLIIAPANLRKQWYQELQDKFGLQGRILEAKSYNAILELYGLVSMIDDRVFGDLDSFRTQFTAQSKDQTFGNLRDRLTNVCKRNRVFVPGSRDDRYSKFIENYEDNFSDWRLIGLRDAFQQGNRLTSWKAAKIKYADKLEEKMAEFVVANAHKVVRTARVAPKDVNESARESGD